MKKKAAPKIKTYLPRKLRKKNINIKHDFMT